MRALSAINGYMLFRLMFDVVDPEQRAERTILRLVKQAIKDALADAQHQPEQGLRSMLVCTP
eukprot:1233687-Amphidinium_carterae.1